MKASDIEAGILSKGGRVRHTGKTKAHVTLSGRTAAFPHVDRGRITQADLETMCTALGITPRDIGGRNTR